MPTSCHFAFALQTSSRRVSAVLFCLLLLFADGVSFAQNESRSVRARQQETLREHLQILSPSRKPHAGRINAIDATWEEWQRRTGALPPDFASMPSLPFLPDPLKPEPSGAPGPILTPQQWQAKRQWIREQAEQWLYGSVPPAPGNVTAEVLSSRREGDVLVERIMLMFGPANKGRLLIEVMTPPGPGPFPVLMTNHPRWRPWVSTAVRRGYIGVFYSASDPNYMIEDYSDKFIELYPDYDFSCLARWGWAGMRAVDYLHTLPKVQKDQIAVTGHSRNGKQALFAAAFDDRIGAVILSSGNTGESTPWRFTPDMFANETIEQITGNFPHWFHPRLRFFAGREHKLPIDQNSIMSLVAPRGLLIVSGFSEGQGAPLGIEEGYRSVQRVYRMMGAEDKLGIWLRPGEHPTTAGDIERYVDFLDHVFQRPGGKPQEELVFDFQIEKWRGRSTEAGAANAFQKTKPVTLDASRWNSQAPQAKEALLALLGEEPAGLPFQLPPSGEPSRYPNDGWLAALYNRPLRGESFTWEAVGFGDDLRADLYRPADAAKDARLPLVIWLHQYAHPTGYSRYFRSWLEQMTSRGFAVMAFDQIGFGTRVLDARDFYRRYPRWSLMGKMVADTRAAVATAAELKTIDPSRIYLAGWALGARVAMYTAALEPRVKGVALVAGFWPQRPDGSPDVKAELDETEALAHWSDIHGLLPQLDSFRGNADALPLDDPAVLALVSPRPVLLVSPTHDRYASQTLVRQGAESVRKIYEKSSTASAFRFEQPIDYNRFPASTQKLVFDWLQQVDAQH